MYIGDIAKMPTEITAEDARNGLSTGCRGFHESLVRSYHIVAKVKELLEKKTDPSVVIELIQVMEDDDWMPYAYHNWEYERQGIPVVEYPTRCGYWRGKDGLLNADH